jgi:hypothetical protein
MATATESIVDQVSPRDRPADEVHELVTPDVAGD